MLMSLGKRLKFEREKRNWSQLHVAEKIGITNTVLSNYERDYRDPDTTTLKKLADLYEVSVDYLLGNSDNSTTDNEKDFQDFINDPELKRWYKELPKSDEEDLRKLKKMWEIMNSDGN